MLYQPMANLPALEPHSNLVLYIINTLTYFSCHIDSWLHADAIRPWQHRCWIFPRGPDFAAKTGRILDLYERGVGGPGSAGRRVCPVGRREDQHPGPRALSPDRPLAARAADEGGARVRPGWGPGLSRGPGCPPGQALRAVRALPGAGPSGPQSSGGLAQPAEFGRGGLGWRRGRPAARDGRAGGPAGGRPQPADRQGHAAD
jgi:hypothetical protein